MDTYQIFVCSCGSPDHQFIVERFIDDEPNLAYLIFHIYLVDGSFWKRIKVAFRYLFCNRSRTMAFDEILLQRSQAILLKDVVDKFLLETKPVEKV